MPTDRSEFRGLRRESDGRLERAFSSEHLLAFPEVRLIGGATVFGGALGSAPLRRVQPGPMMLEGMARLCMASDEEIRQYALSWGPLYTCEHGFPQPHHADCQPPQWDEPKVWSSGEYADPLACWRELSSVCRILLTTCDSLQRDKAYAIPEADSALLEKWFTFAPRLGDDIARQRRELAMAVAEWQYCARVHLRPVWTDERPDVRLGGHGLYAALGAQVLMVLAAKDGFAICVCGTPYIPKRRPREDEDHYCDGCREAGRPVQAAKRRYRAEQRRKAARRKVTKIATARP